MQPFKLNIPMDPITAIEGLENEVRRIDFQGNSPYQSINVIKEEEKKGFDIEIINQLKLIKPKIQLFYEDRSEIKPSRVSLGVLGTRKNSSNRILVSNGMEEITIKADRPIQQGFVAGANRRS